MSFYEEHGPDDNFVREYLYKKKIQEYPELQDLYIIRVLLKHIPITDIPTNGYGSWRGWATFGFSRVRDNAIIVDLDKGVQALHKLKQLFNYYLIHYLYKPGSIRAQNIQINSLIGKR